MIIWQIDRDTHVGSTTNKTTIWDRKKESNYDWLLLNAFIKLFMHLAFYRLIKIILTCFFQFL